MAQPNRTAGAREHFHGDFPHSRPEELPLGADIPD